MPRTVWLDNPFWDSFTPKATISDVPIFVNWLPVNSGMMCFARLLPYPLTVLGLKMSMSPTINMCENEGSQPLFQRNKRHA